MNRVQLYRPIGFQDSTTVAMNPKTGEMIPWPWGQLNPEDFSVDDSNHIFHHCDDRLTWSRIVRHGLDATNFIVDDCPQPSPSHPRSLACGAPGVVPQSSYRGIIQLRKKKHRTRKYKNYRWRYNEVQYNKKQRRKRKQRRKKAFKQAAFTPARAAEVCAYCSATSAHENLFHRPQVRHYCDCCDIRIDKEYLALTCCERCLLSGARSVFCEECRRRLGDWHPDWRMSQLTHRHVEIGQHPTRCRCQRCLLPRCRWCGNRDCPPDECDRGYMITYDDERDESWRDEDDRCAPPDRWDDNWKFYYWGYE